MPTGHLGTFTAATVAGAGSTLNIISITPPEETIEDIALPHLGLAKGSYVPYEAGELIEGGEYEIELADDNNIQIVDVAGTTGATFKTIIRSPLTMLWTKPPASGLTNGASRSFSGYVKSVKENQQVTGQRNTITIKVKVAGNVTKAAGS